MWLVHEAIARDRIRDRQHEAEQERLARASRASLAGAGHRRDTPAGGGSPAGQLRLRVAHLFRRLAGGATAVARACARTAARLEGIEGRAA